ncbi:MAG: hypothetical protein NXY57DRAFT_1041329 [Lentinula lateritia]|uniref:Secreted protein n=1 Tax=Lentinula lateritia TaxID=40482 RepID=A0ABQ8V875_9AGAR|nr:MAG: hypothetical protein NXY57DRAFT_1041329 [Lentinula lateritia]KAJ4479504.1 hypothetical protein C8R41DRAFT_869298 [Lentinula lateritia]
MYSNALVCLLVSYVTLKSRTDESEALTARRGGHNAPSRSQFLSGEAYEGNIELITDVGIRIPERDIVDDNTTCGTYNRQVGEDFCLFFRVLNGKHRLTNRHRNFDIEAACKIGKCYTSYVQDLSGD